MKCFNCGSENWENVDQYRYKDTDKKGKKINMSICRDCAAISYPDRWMSKEEIYAHYKKDYRPAPNVNNLFTGLRKNHFHAAFLKDLFEQWQKDKKESPVICDIGTAYGMSLGLFKTLFPKADINGTELTETMKRVSYHEFGFKLTDEIDETKKYDMIMSYKVLEHQLDPMQELQKYSKLLKEDGVLYISVPTWFNIMCNFGLDGFDLEYYYDPNHINVWTKEMFENILLRSGFEIIKEDHQIYGDTYLCKPSAKHKDLAPLIHNIGEIKNKLDKIKTAFLRFTEYQYDEAIDIYPEYPQAWIAKLEMNRKLIAEKGFATFHDLFIKPMLAACPNSPECVICATDFAMRAGEFDIAINYGNKALEMKPNNPVTLGQFMNLFKELALNSSNEKEKITYFKKAKEFAVHLSNVSLQNRDEAISHIYLLNSLIPVGE